MTLTDHTHPDADVDVDVDVDKLDGGGDGDLDEWDRVDDTEQAPQPRFASVQEWVDQWLVPLLRREVNIKAGGHTLAWCDRWWAHAEAIDRLEACWRAWEVARLDAGRGMADWWLTVMDPMWAQLTHAEVGPFGRCWRYGHSDELPQVPAAPSPPGWWDGT